MEKNIRIIYSDIDGTLLNNNHHIFPRTREKILELDQRGIPFILVSARTPKGVRLIQRELGNKRPIVSYSGGLILEENGHMLYSRQIELELACTVALELERECPDICCNAYNGDLWVVRDDQNPWVMREEKITREKSIKGDFGRIFAGRGGIHKFLLMGNPQAIVRAEDFLKEKYAALTILRSNEYYLEVMEGSVDKEAGVRFLCDYYGISLCQAAAFGDGENDVGMLQAVGYGFAMGNASEKVKKQVSHVTAGNEEEGIWEVIRNI